MATSSGWTSAGAMLQLLAKGRGSQRTAQEGNELTPSGDDVGWGSRGQGMNRFRDCRAMPSLEGLSSHRGQRAHSMSTKELHFMSKATLRHPSRYDAARGAHTTGFSDSQPLHQDTSPSSSHNDCTHAIDGSQCFRLLDTTERRHQFR
jgi:hypothetical protein